MYTTIDDAMEALHTAELDVANEWGDDMVDQAYSDLVHSIASMCTRDVADELRRRTIGGDGEG